MREVMRAAARRRTWPRRSRRSVQARPDAARSGGAELDSRIGDDRQRSMREDPAPDVVRPLPRRRILTRELVLEDPLVRRRPHRHRTNARDEVAVVQRPIILALADEKPVQRVVGVGDKAVEAGRRSTESGSPCTSLQQLRFAARSAMLGAHQREGRCDTSSSSQQQRSWRPPS
jgi:hypothetical protein